jgi:hypothetical protein
MELVCEQVRVVNRLPRTEARRHKWAHGFFPAMLCETVAEFRRFDDYLSRLSQFIQEERKRFLTDVETLAATEVVGPEDADRFYDAYLDQYETLHSFFPNTLRHSALMAACSLFESRLTGACRELEDDSVAAISTDLEDCDGQGIHRAASFLRRNLSIHPEDHWAWGPINDYFVIRNFIAHASGEFSLALRHEDKVRAAMRRLALPDVSESDTGTSLLTDAFIGKVIDDMGQFWDALARAFEENRTVGPIYWP